MVFILKISDSFRKFGMSDSADSVFVVIVNDTEDKTLHRLIEIIDGQQVAVSDVKHFCDETLVKKVSVLMFVKFLFVIRPHF
ncbi:hypothetical protein DPMN_121322 [Dreissena polymorpha]|uniref:Uncharacterized protein n=1 Tax=Dreissena polymorpha TaxID=45954 RepID=A0A9D4GPW3_DREPO|nr:hypothetical protein DPMN_121322 [Dreissena polymorpha]